MQHPKASQDACPLPPVTLCHQSLAIPQSAQCSRLFGLAVDELKPKGPILKNSGTVLGNGNISVLEGPQVLTGFLISYTHKASSCLEREVHGCLLIAGIELGPQSLAFAEPCVHASVALHLDQSSLKS